MSHSQQPMSQSSALDRPGPEPELSDVRRGRAVGVMLIAMMFLVYAVVVGVYAFLAAQALSYPSLTAASRSDARLDLILSLAQLPFYALTAVGVWRLQQWGRYLALVFLSLNIARFVVEAFWFPTLAYGLLAALSRSIIPLAIMLYLLHPSVQPMFRSRREE